LLDILPRTILNGLTTYTAVASLGLVSPGVATDGVTPIFPSKKLATFFHSGVTPPGWCHPVRSPAPLVMPLFYSISHLGESILLFEDYKLWCMRH